MIRTVNSADNVAIHHGSDHGTETESTHDTEESSEQQSNNATRNIEDGEEPPSKCTIQTSAYIFG